LQKGLNLCLKRSTFIRIKPDEIEAELGAAKPCGEIVAPLANGFQLSGEPPHVIE
jgi:hypothetical protein